MLLCRPHRHANRSAHGRNYFSNHRHCLLCRSPNDVGGIVSDAEDTPSELSVVWESSLDGILSGDLAAPDSEGLLLGATYLSAGEHSLTLTATDLSGKDGRTSATILVIEENSAPVCNYKPHHNTIQSDEVAIFQATIADRKPHSQSFHFPGLLILMETWALVRWKQMER